jgi:hypothetical protein
LGCRKNGAKSRRSGLQIKHLIRPSGGCPEKAGLWQSVLPPLCCTGDCKKKTLFVKGGFFGSHSKATGWGKPWRKGSLVLRGVLRRQKHCP